MDDGAPHDRWYIITVGTRVGVLRGWTNVGPLVLGSPHSVFQRVESRQVGIALFNQAMEDNAVRTI